MFTRREIEDMILGMAEVVIENRALRKALNETEIECETYKALFLGEHKKAEILSDISINNATVNSIHSMGGLTNQIYIEDWKAELERRIAEKKRK